jgi:hypothetical protein
MKRNTAQNGAINANELANVLAQTIASVFAGLGIVQVNTHPSSVPNSAAKVTQRPAQNNIVASVPRRPATQTATRTETRTAQASQTLRTAQVPDFGDFYVKVGDKAGYRPNRSKLPQGMFEGFDAIVCNLPTGESVVCNKDVEGRGRLNKAQLDSMRVEAGHTLVFTRVEDGVFDVEIVGDAQTQTRTQAQRPAARRNTSPVLDLPDLDDEFWADDNTQAQTQTRANGKVKRARSAAQLANDAKLRERANMRVECVECGAELTLLQSRREGSGYVCKGQHMQSVSRARHVAVRPTQAQKRVEARREENHTNAATKQTQYAQTHTRAGIASVPQSSSVRRPKTGYTVPTRRA